MYKACIAVVDASRARLFTFERSSEVEGLKEGFHEQRDLIDPARRLRGSELFSESRPGTSRSGNLQYAFDDHRDAHIEHLDAEFARTVVGELADLLQSSHAQRLILCASPNMLGEIRQARTALPRDIEIDEVARNLVKLTPAQLRDQLASYGLLPARPSRPQA
jgi:protein required for attachment to host cells